MKRLITIVLAALVTLVAACGDDDAGTTTTTLPEGAVIAEFSTPDGNFKVLLTGTAAEQARTAFANGTQPGIPNGRILRGDGGVNTGHDWHLVEVEFADLAIEVCDGTANYIDTVGYDEWIANAGDRYCPWGAQLIAVTE
ncbi:MAG TPA: hypothetical protein VFY15_00040 [Acidimicrobiia bacterium]|nr:hypothetical protein [Acidimicrobiia bacterium]